MGGKAVAKMLLDMYHRLLSHYGPQHWWPADSPFEVIIGAILTQSAAWTNAERAIVNLKTEGVLSPPALRQIPIEELSQLIYPAGYYNAKAVKIKSFVQWLEEYYEYSLDRLFILDTQLLRRELLSVHGIGEETADSIILFAAKKAIFVIDAYTRRIISRLGLEPPTSSYTAFQDLFMQHLPHDESLFNEYHALLVCHGKVTCKKRPLCHDCCLNSICLFNDC
ncbi:endonuclease III domain-containing protein [Chloroflexota bacterium]